MPPAPLIVTLLLDQAAQARFDALRTAYFPPERLVVGAHTTMFHALPGTAMASLTEALAEEADAVAPFAVTVASVRFMGRGVAFALQSPLLMELRERLRQRWADRLTPQDRQRWQPHITIQNKVEPTVARNLHARLAESFTPYPVLAAGLALWHYRSGPWEPAGHFAFRGMASHPCRLAP